MAVGGTNGAGCVDGKVVGSNAPCPDPGAGAGAVTGAGSFLDRLRSQANTYIDQHADAKTAADIRSLGSDVQDKAVQAVQNTVASHTSPAIAAQVGDQLHKLQSQPLGQPTAPQPSAPPASAPHPNDSHPSLLERATSFFHDALSGHGSTPPQPPPAHH